MRGIKYNERKMMATETAAKPLTIATSPAALNQLIADIDDKALKADKYGNWWGLARWATTILLGVLSSTVAAKDSLKSSVLPDLTGWIPVFALLVAIFTLLDQTIKPGAKWQLSGKYAAQFRQMGVRARATDPNSVKDVLALSSDFLALQADWLKDTTIG
jgi:hypothetical protein